MIKSTAMILSAAALLALAAGQAMTPALAYDEGPWACDDHPGVYVSGSPPVVSYWCPAPHNSPEPIQLDVYIDDDRVGPDFWPCSFPETEGQIIELFCG